MAAEREGPWAWRRGRGERTHAASCHDPGLPPTATRNLLRDPSRIFKIIADLTLRRPRSAPARRRRRSASAYGVSDTCAAGARRVPRPLAHVCRPVGLPVIESISHQNYTERCGPRGAGGARVARGRPAAAGASRSRP
ncbi:hypothetical protein EVAR_21982_1 [Eumeta japonica]|uniref:Uncharacterized protein n=1 Tax=Eumeta variegata TaxID=151549 RepID=A0A4C1VU63_EUMVA|nr:hypothetical protein EVAR_21982_1 [Eumeta japonica]